MIKNFWVNLGLGARIGFVFGVVTILVVTGIIAVSLLRSNYQVLFANLAPEDASAMTGELDRMKVPYELDENGTAILVDKESVHKTRISLMGKDIPLRGAVGFEIFNNADFGMTEFAQKVNFQRALQGEITRTILSLDEIQSARVHLAMAEDGLFKKAENKPKAAITLSMKSGRALIPEQVSGIQRLVSAAVPGIATQDVTIVDQRGIALTRTASTEAESAGGASRLDMKKETEKYLATKISAVLDRALGAGQAMATVDVTLDMDHVRVTTEDVLGAPSRQGQIAGIIVKEREQSQDGALLLDAKSGASARGTSTREVDYQVGRRVEQIVSSPGSIKKMQAVAVIKKALSKEQQEQLQKSILAAMGGSIERGDVVVIQNFSEAVDQVREPEAIANHDSQLASIPARVTKSTAKSSASVLPGLQDVLSVAAVVVVIIFFAIFLFRIPRKTLPQTLSEQQKEQALKQVRGWLRERDEVREYQS